MKKKCLLTFILAFCSVFISISFAGCNLNKTYKGEYPDLYTVAINSILWNAGYSQQIETTEQPEIEILEKDDYGRTLYTYYETSRAEKNLVISQYSEEDYVYYYEDFNFLQKEGRRTAFSEEESDYLKSLNDWGKELDLDKCVKKRIVRKKQSIPCDEKIIEEKVVQRFNEKGECFQTDLNYLTSDNSGNFLVYGDVSIKNVSGALIYFVIFIDADCEKFNFLVVSEIYSYQEELLGKYSYQEKLKTFKAENGWVSK